MEEHKLILVYYIGTGLVQESELDQFLSEVISKIKTESSVVGEIIVIPTKDIDTRIECINPVYITEPELIRQHRLKMDELHENIDYNLSLIKKNKENG